MPPIKIIRYKKADTQWQFKVAIGLPDDQTIHQVTLSKAYFQKLNLRETAPDQLVAKSFEFLLAREPKESILPAFDMSVIQSYFPEYEEAIRQNISQN